MSIATALSRAPLSLKRRQNSRSAWLPRPWPTQMMRPLSRSMTSVMYLRARPCRWQLREPCGNRCAGNPFPVVFAPLFLQCPTQQEPSGHVGQGHESGQIHNQSPERTRDFRVGFDKGGFCSNSSPVVVFNRGTFLEHHWFEPDGHAAHRAPPISVPSQLLPGGTSGSFSGSNSKTISPFSYRVRRYR